MIDNFILYNKELAMPVGINDRLNDPELYVKIFPNPAGEQLTVGVESGEPATITILDVKGNMIFRKSFVSSIDIRKSEIGGAGFYLVIVTEGTRQHTGRLILN